MKIQTFKNGKGLIYGNDPKRIGAERSGVLTIGTTDIKVSSDEDLLLPLLFHGATGNYAAKFTDDEGGSYELEKVAVRGGRIVPPSPTSVELMELRNRADMLENERDAMREQLDVLEHIFDTDALNFLIK